MKNASHPDKLARGKKEKNLPRKGTYGLAKRHISLFGLCFDAKGKVNHQPGPHAYHKHAAKGHMPHEYIADGHLHSNGQHDARFSFPGHSFALGIAFQVMVTEMTRMKEDGLIDFRGNEFEIFQTTQTK